MKNEINPEIQILLKKMCDTVGAKYEPKLFLTEQWYNKYWWTETEEQEFKQFIKNLLIKNTKFRNAFLNDGTIKNRKTYDKAIDQFCFNFGWYTLYIHKEKNLKGYKEKEIKNCLSKKQFKDFQNFMCGQTVGVSGDGDHVTYVYDFERWASHVKRRKRK